MYTILVHTGVGEFLFSKLFPKVNKKIMANVLVSMEKR
jgi:hypothetical protein